MYKSPIEKIYGELQTQMMQEDEKMVMKAIRKVGVNVDKEALIKALQYDRNQYAKGYEDGKNDVLEKLRAEIGRLKYQNTNFDVYRWWNNAIDNCLLEIDKYKAETEQT